VKQEKLIPTRLSEKEMVEFLRKRGYTVEKPPKEAQSNKISNLSLVDYFYSSLNKKATDSELFVLGTTDRSNDYKAIKVFQDKAKQQGKSKSEANELLYQVLVWLFKYYEDIGLESLIPSLHWLLIGKGNWVIKKTIKLHQRFIENYGDSEEFQAVLHQVSEKPSENIIKFIENRHQDLLRLYDEIQGENSD
jgi:3',5'-cyclic AMP phosphodiesterase CpdA